MSFPYQLDRMINIDAPPETVFSFFTVNAKWASWWGQGSTIEPRTGGRVLVVHPGNIRMSGEVLEIQSPTRIVFTYGYETGGLVPPGGSRVTIRLEAIEAGTRLHLTHEFSDVIPRDEHVQGWRFQLSLFSNAVMNDLHAGAQQVVDDWFGAWAEPDASVRSRTLERVASTTIQFRDRFSALSGNEDVAAHITAAQRFMPGLTLKRRGDVRHCQGMVLADWDAIGADGASRGSGTNVFQLGADGRIVLATGFWSK